MLESAEANADKLQSALVLERVFYADWTDNSGKTQREEYDTGRNGEISWCDGAGGE